MWFHRGNIDRSILPVERASTVHNVTINNMRSGEMQHARPVCGTEGRDVELPTRLRRHCRDALHQSYLDYNDHGWEHHELQCTQPELVPPEGHIYTVAEGEAGFSLSIRSRPPPEMKCQ